jgi:hypothetical protein
MKQETQYLGYRIVCRSAGRLFAQIFPPDSPKPLKEVPVANHAEGMDHLLALARHTVDQHQAVARHVAKPS